MSVTRLQKRNPPDKCCASSSQALLMLQNIDTSSAIDGEDGHASQLVCPSLEVEKWDKTHLIEAKAVRDTLLADIGLLNDIHPVFKRQRFQDITSKHYNLLIPSLKLASKMLDDDACLA
jgi:hypothetical protein